LLTVAVCMYVWQRDTHVWLTVSTRMSRSLKHSLKSVKVAMCMCERETHTSQCVCVRERHTHCNVYVCERETHIAMCMCERERHTSQCVCERERHTHSTDREHKNIAQLKAQFEIGEGRNVYVWERERHPFYWPWRSQRVYVWERHTSQCVCVWERHTHSTDQ